MKVKSKTRRAYAIPASVDRPRDDIGFRSRQVHEEAERRETHSAGAHS